MINKLGPFVLLLATASLSQAQTTETTKKTGRPDIPGTFVFEIGVNRGLEAPPKFSIGLWGSRAVNLYYQYDFRILKSKFSFVPAIGVSLERYNFKEKTILGYDAEDSLTLLTGTDAGFPGIKKSQFITNYVEVPLHFQYLSKPDDPGRSFKIQIGGRIGYLYDSFNKLKYKEEGELRKLKDKRQFNLNEFRYGLSAKIGVGNFSVFGYYNLNNLFEDGKGLGYKGEIVDFPTFTVGISLSSF
jgi:hypothetical protein